jgi:hypothetical protein
LVGMGPLPGGWGVGSDPERCDCVVEELADAIAGVGQDREGAAVVPGDIDGALGDVADADDRALVARLEIGEGVVGGWR